MKKRILSILLVLFGISVFPACNSEQGPSELDLLIENLPTSNLTEAPPEGSDESSTDTEASAYKSATGVLVSVSEDSITISAEGKEYKFLIDENTRILAGSLPSAVNITVSYNEASVSDKNYIAEIITVLNTTETSEKDSQTQNSDESTEPIENTENSDESTETLENTDEQTLE